MFSILLFILLSIVTLIYWLGYRKPLHGIDDANIYFVYIENFASGNGFVWEQGGERVEGFTSLLWTLIGSLCFLITPANYTLLLLLLNVLLTYATIHRLLFFVRRINREEHKTITATDILILAMLFFPLGFIEWSILTLMETGLWIFLIVYATLALADQYIGHKRVNMPVFCTMIACILLTRPEGLLFGLLLIALLFAMTYWEQDLRSASRTSAFPFAAYSITAIGVVLWRLSYFGYPFPNTFYAKVSGSLTDNLVAGMQYLLKFFYTYPHLAIIVAALFIQSILLLRKLFREKSTKSLMLPEKAQAVVLIVVFIGLFVPVLTGGDHFYYSRFYQPIIPLVIAASLNFPLWEKYVGKINLHGKWSDKVLALLFSFGIFSFQNLHGLICVNLKVLQAKEYFRISR